MFNKEKNDKVNWHRRSLKASREFRNHCGVRLLLPGEPVEPRSSI
jgi:hypothetical protein